MEIRLERRINEPETIDHKNGNIKDDKYTNLALLDRPEHSKLDAKVWIRPSSKQLVTKCVYCNSKFVQTITQWEMKLNKAGPFCSRSCSGKYGTDIQNRRLKKIKRKFNKKKYSTLLSSAK